MGGRGEIYRRGLGMLNRKRQEDSAIVAKMCDC